MAAEEREKKKSGERESSPKHSGFSKLFKRRENRRSHSIKDFDSSQREDKKSSKKGAKISFPSRSKDGLSAVSETTHVTKRMLEKISLKFWLLQSPFDTHLFVTDILAWTLKHTCTNQANVVNMVVSKSESAKKNGLAT